MIIAGIDEAGLGPAMGPLTVCMSAIRLPGTADDEYPWQALDTVVTRTRRGSPVRLLVTDSKIAYRAKNIATLERTVLAFLVAAGRLKTTGPTSFSDTLADLGSADIVALLPAIPWYQPSGWQIPRTDFLPGLGRNSSSLIHALASANMEVVGLRARVCPALYLNREFDRGLNKSEALMRELTLHLHYICALAKDEPIRIVVDKLGGRNRYLPLLMQVFPGQWIQTISEGPKASEYILPHYQSGIRIRFMVKADQQAFTVALASMLAKYLRECCMEQFNAFFAGHLPGIKPTAGYHGDAPRFLDEVASLLVSLGINHEMLVRKR